MDYWFYWIPHSWFPTVNNLAFCFQTKHLNSIKPGNKREPDILCFSITGKEKMTKSSKKNSPNFFFVCVCGGADSVFIQPVTS